MVLKIVNGDLLKATDEVIVQQLNCLCVRPHGLSKVIADKYPYAAVYSQRKQKGRMNLCVGADKGTPGKIVASVDPLNKGPIVVGLYGQYDYGKPGKSWRSTLEEDNYQLREKWFIQCLAGLDIWALENNIKTIAFPYKIGCGLAGGNWGKYFKHLKDFANGKPYNVTIYKLE